MILTTIENFSKKTIKPSQRGEDWKEEGETIATHPMKALE